MRLSGLSSFFSLNGPSRLSRLSRYLALSTLSRFSGLCGLLSLRRLLALILVRIAIAFANGNHSLQLGGSLHASRLGLVRLIITGVRLGVGQNILFRSLSRSLRIVIQLLDHFDRTTLITRLLGDHINMEIVICGLRLHPQVARLRRLDLGMLAAPVIDRHHAAIIRAPLIRAHAEHEIQFTLQRHEEPTGGAQVAVRGFGGQRLRAARALIPTLRHLCAPLRG